MKKLKLKLEEVGEILTRDQLKRIIGGSGDSFEAGDCCFYQRWANTGETTYVCGVSERSATYACVTRQGSSPDYFCAWHC